MSENLVTITLHTQVASADFTVQHYLYPEQRVRSQVALNVVQVMELPGGEIVENPYHSTSIDTITSDGETRGEAITLPEDKARRLIELFRSLRPGHEFQCHDVITQTEGWQYDRGSEFIQKCIQPPEFVLEAEDIRSGEAYTVSIVRLEGDKTDFLPTHSALGTDNDRLLGLIGSGMMMATVDPETTRTLYANGAKYSMLARIMITD